jgi:hypothetical protein
MIPVFVPAPVMPQAAAAYAGPGNVVSGASAWWGLRGYSAAAVGANAVQLRRSSDNVVQTFTVQSNGGLPLPAIIAFKGAANLFVATLYDQTGNGFDLVQATLTQQFAFILNGLGSFPVVRASGAGSLRSAGSLTQAQPVSGSFVAKRTGNFTSFQDVFDNGGTTPALQIGFGNMSNDSYMSTANNRTILDGATDNVMHAVNAVFNGVSSVLSTDGATGTTGNAGTTGLTGRFGSNVARAVLTGDFVEGGFWPLGFTTTQVTNLNTNQHAYWGF